MEKMKIFVSWSGVRSAAVAEILKEYLPVINNSFELWLSSEDITKGSRSTLEIAKALAAARAGIICLTPNNLTSAWILFEAGGIAKQVENPLACTLLIGLEPRDVSKPLSEFQHTRLNEKELLQLVKNLNNAAREGARKDTEIDKAFALCWPEIDAKLGKLPTDGPTKLPQRTVEGMLEELIDLARATSSEVAEINHRTVAEFEKSLAMQVQLEYLTDLSTPPSSLWNTETMRDAAVSGMLSAGDGSSSATARMKRALFGAAGAPQAGKIARALKRDQNVAGARATGSEPTEKSEKE
jgi:TIR domain